MKKKKLVCKKCSVEITTKKKFNFWGLKKYKCQECGFENILGIEFFQSFIYIVCVIFWPWQFFSTGRIEGYFWFVVGIIGIGICVLGIYRQKQVLKETKTNI